MMADFIEVHDNHGLVLMNLGQVFSFIPDSRGTICCLPGDKLYLLKESYDEIRKMVLRRRLNPGSMEKYGLD